jgi:CDP-diacylglycerol--glycerol-3-phosphate 3-phosphatidyltransferase
VSWPTIAPTMVVPGDEAATPDQPLTSRPAASRAAGAARPEPAVRRERLWNLPNTLTVLRIAVVPVFLVFPWVESSRLGSQIVAWLFIVAAVTDVVDGWLARRGYGVTSIGKLLDPLADKMLVTAALILLLAVGRIPLWGAVMVVVIVGRELAVTGLRSIASTEGYVVAAARLGKLKAVFQNIAIGALFFPDPTLGLPAHRIGVGMLALATGLTLWSGYVYFADYFGWRGGAGLPEAQAVPGSRGAEE